MTRGPQLRTNRLVLRRWLSDDLPLLAAINSDPDVMEHFPELLDEAETTRFIEDLEAHFEQHGFGLWALQHRLTGEVIGFAGLSVPTFEAHFTPAVEVGWRLAKHHWGNGYVTEAARAALAYGFETADLEEIVSMAVTANIRSTKVMERLGMTSDPEDDFDHPRLAEDSPLRRHVLYRMSSDRWAQLNRR